MIEKIIGRSVLQDLSEITENVVPITVEGITISNPNDIDQWISKAISARGDLKEKVFAEAITFAAGLPDKYRSDFTRALLRNITEEYGNLPESLKPAGPKNYPVTVETLVASEPVLSEADIKKIAQGAGLRKRQLEQIDQYMSFKDEPVGGGFMGAMAEESQLELPGALAAYSATFNEEYPGLEDLMIVIKHMPKDVGRRFDAHGIAKGYIFESLITLLTEGVDLNRPFHTMPLVEDIEAAALGAGAPYADGGIIVVGPVNGEAESGSITQRKLIVDREKDTTNIKYVILDREYYFAFPQIEKAFPKVKFVRAADAITFFTEEVEKRDKGF